MKKQLLILFLLVGTFVNVTAQNRPNRPQSEEKSSDTTRRAAGTALGSGNKAQPKPYTEVITKDALTQKGMITSHRIDDKYFFEIADSVLNRDILIVSRISKSAAGLRDIQGYAGDQIGSSVIRFEKGPDDRIFMREISYKVYSPDSTTAMYQSVKNSTLQAIVGSWNIAAFSPDSNGSVIDMTSYMNSDNDVLYFSSPRVKTNLQLGGQQNDRSYINAVRSFPSNVEINVVKTYKKSASPASGSASGGGRAGADATGTVTLELNASLVLLPEKPMQPRYFDPRVGFFAVGYTDFDLNPQGVKEISVVKRWRLEPRPEDMAKYKRGELVEPIKPIVFYIDPATPKKWIPYLIAGVNDWQKAFEKAGFKNAIIGKEAPTSAQDSTWSLDDARHSAIVYKPSEIPNASGPSISDPRSGEIMESHINWYHNVMKLVHDWYMIQTAAVDKRARTMEFSDELMGDLIRFVSSHEVGHTLGLRHNYGSSSTVPTEYLRDKKWVEANGHTPSIMDYARFNYVAQPGDNISKEGLYPRIGDYDKWAIEWGYKYFPDSEGVEADMKALNKMTIEAAKNARLWFGTETNPNDPRSQSEDLSNNAMLASTYGIENLKIILENLPEWTGKTGENYSDLSGMYGQLTTQFSRYMGHVTKNVAGVYETPKMVGQSGPVYERTPATVQKEAMTFLNKQLFITPKWILNQIILDKIGEDPITIVYRLQNATLDRLVSNHTMSKLITAEAVDGAQAYKIADLFTDLNNSIFTELKNNAAIDVYRRNLQKAYVEKLIAIVKPAPAAPATGNVVRLRVGAMDRSLPAEQTDVASVIRGELRGLQDAISDASDAQQDTLSKYHLVDLEERIDAALDLGK